MSAITIQENRNITIDNKPSHELINKRIIDSDDYGRTPSSDGNLSSDKYSSKQIVGSLNKSDFKGNVSFFFNNKSDFITLYSNGQLNAKDGEEGLFKAWGISEFKDLNPKTVFEELEDQVTKIELNSALGNKNYSFKSYSDFINCVEVQISKH